MSTPTIPAPIERIGSRLHRTLYRRSSGCRGARSVRTGARSRCSPPPVAARDADPDERAERWPRLTAMYSGYQDYAVKTTRVLQVVVLERKDRR